MSSSLAKPGIQDLITSTQQLWSSSKIDAEIAAVSGAYAYRRECLDYVDNTAAPPTENLGDRYILDDTGASHADWDGVAPLHIAEFNGSTWDDIAPSSGWRCNVLNEGQDRAYIDDGTPAWEPRPHLQPHTLGGSNHTPDTLANLNSKVTDATLDGTTDKRDTDSNRVDLVDIIGTPAVDKLNELLHRLGSAGTKPGSSSCRACRLRRSRPDPTSGAP